MTKVISHLLTTKSMLTPLNEPQELAIFIEHLLCVGTFLDYGNKMGDKTDKYPFFQGVILPFRKLASLFKEANKSNKEYVRW